MASVPQATANMCRNTLEGDLSALGAIGKNLPAMLEKLQAMGKLSHDHGPAQVGWHVVPVHVG